MIEQEDTQTWAPPKDAVPAKQTAWKPPSDAMPVKKKESTSVESSTGSKTSQDHDFTHGYQPSPVDIKKRDEFNNQQQSFESTPEQRKLSDQLNVAQQAYEAHLTSQEHATLNQTKQAIANRPKDTLRKPSAEEVKQQHAMDTTTGKILKSLAYTGSETLKGGVDVLKGGAWVLNHMNTGLQDAQLIPDKAFKPIDKATDLGVTPGQREQIEGSKNIGMSAVRTLGMLGNIAPAAIGGEAVAIPKTMFALQGIGQGKNTMDAVDPEHKLNPAVRDLYIAGSGLVNGLIVGDIGENVLSKPVQEKVVSGIVSHAMQDAAEKGLTEDALKSSVKSATENFLHSYAEKTAKTGVDLSALQAAQFTLKKGVDVASDEPVFNEHLGTLMDNISDVVTKQAPLFGGVGAMLGGEHPEQREKINLGEQISDLDDKIKQFSEKSDDPVKNAENEVNLEQANKDREELNNQLKKIIKNEKEKSAVNNGSTEQEVRSKGEESVNGQQVAERPENTDSGSQAVASEQKTNDEGLRVNNGAENAPLNKREKIIPDNEAPDVEELGRNLKESGKPGISIEPSYTHEYGTGKLTNDELENGNKYVVSRGDNGKVNGVIEISYNGDNGVEKNPVDIKVAVSESERRKGIATKLFKHAEDEGIDLSKVRGIATTEAGQKLYESNFKQNDTKTEQPEANGSKKEANASETAEHAGSERHGDTKGEDEGNKEVKKTILTKRAYEGDIQPEVKKHLEEKGLTRKSFSQEERSKQATDFINKFGEDAAEMAVKQGDVEGGMASSVLAQLQVKNNRAMSELDPESPKYEKLAKKNADLIELAENKGYLSGEFAGQLAYEYQNSELNYANIKRQVEKSTGKPLSESQNKKIKELSSDNEKLKKQLGDAEKRLIEETDKAFQLGKEESKNQSKADKAKKVANKLRSLKINSVNDATLGIPVALYNGAIETSATLLEAGGKLADAIDAGIKHIKESDWYKGLSESKKKSVENDFREHINGNSESTELPDLQERFLNKKGNKFTPSEAKSLWSYMKENYINNGVSYRDAIAKTADDLGLSWRQVSEAIVTPKTKRISDEMWKRQYDWNRYRISAKNWIGDQNKSMAGKALKEVSGLFRGVAVFGHGGIFVGTHAGMNLFNPSTWNKTIPAFLNGWKFAYGNEGKYQMAMEELKNSPNYVIAQRAGLKNDPDRINAEEYQKSQKYLGKLGEAGEKGFNAIKVLRQGLFDYDFNKLTEAERQDPAVAKSIAHIVNLATGATTLKIPEWVNEVSFAGGMEASRWEKLTSNPIKATKVAIKALVTPEKATTAEKVFAKVWARRVGEQVATYATALAANAAIQNTLYPSNPVNLTDPSKPDFLEFKMGDVAIDPTSGMRGTGQFIYQIGKIPFEPQKELRGEDRVKVLSKKIGQHAKGKLAPFYSTLAEVYSGRDFSGNVVPWSKERPPSYGHKLTPAEYASSKLPLPLAEAMDVMFKSAQEHAGKDIKTDDVFKGLFSGAISGTTGFRVHEDKPTKKNRFSIK